VKCWMEVGPFRSLDAMVGPEDLTTIGDRDRLKRSSAHMTGSERRMSGRMPVLGRRCVREMCEQCVDRRYDGIPVRHGQCAARTEVSLDIDSKQQVGFFRADHGKTSWSSV